MQKLMDMLVNALTSGALLQGLITLGLLGFYGVLVLRGQPVPQDLPGWIALTLGFYFGGKAQGALAGALRT